MLASALVLTSAESPAAILDIEVPDPGPSQVRVRVEAATLNGFDRALAAGYLWQMLPHEFPVGIGRDLVGVVESAGGSSGFAPAERVVGILPGGALGTGTVAQYVTIDAAQVTALPDGLDPVEVAAATGLAGATAAGVDAALKVDRGETVLIAGTTGGVGSYLVPLLRRRGIRVLATARDDGHAPDYVRDLGADVVVLVGDGMAAAVAEAAPDGVNGVAHLAGDPVELAAFLLPGGRLISPLGALPGTVGRDDVEVVYFIADTSAAPQARLVGRMREGTLSPRVSSVFPFAKAVDALGAMSEPKLGKVVVDVADLTG